MRDRDKLSASATEMLRMHLLDCGRARDADDYYGYSMEQLSLLGDDIRQGQRSSWVVNVGESVKIDPDLVRPVEGNLFDARKLTAVACAVMSGGSPTFGAGYGDVSLVEARDIEEDQAYFDEHYDRFSMRPLDKRDLGKLLFQVRDGNHRVFGSLLGGETDVWMNLTSAKAQDMRQYRREAQKHNKRELAKIFGKGHVKLMEALLEKTSKG